MSLTKIYVTVCGHGISVSGGVVLDAVNRFYNAAVNAYRSLSEEERRVPLEIQNLLNSAWSEFYNHMQKVLEYFLRTIRVLFLLKYI